MLWKIMVFFLVVIIFALLLKIFYMRKAIREIKRGFSEKLYTDTNTPIMLKRKQLVLGLTAFIIKDTI